MKLCIIIPKAYPVFNPRIKTTFGGAEVQLTLIGKELARQQDLEIEFMVADYGQKNVEIYNRIKVWKSLNFKDHIIKQILSFFLVFKKINADVYIQEMLTPFSGLIAFYCRMTGKTFVFLVAHDSETDGSHRVYKNKITGFLANLVFSYSNLIVSQNNYQKNNLEERNIKSVIIKTGYSISGDIHRKKNYILWVARSDSFKRPLLFLKLAEANPTKKFVMICPSATKNRRLFEKVRLKSQKIKNLEFIEFVPFHEIDKYFKEASIFVNTSTQEGFPNTFIQATKNNTPIISLNVNPDNILTEYNCGFYCNDDFNLMNTNLNELLSNKELYKKMSLNAIEYAKKNHDVKKIAKQLLSQINKIEI